MIAKTSDFMIRQNDIKETYLQKDVERNQKLRDAWGTHLAQVRLEQEKHGQAMGMLIAIGKSAELGMAQQGFANMSALTQSKNAKTFAIGKASGIASATISTYIGAAKALEAGPIMGPILAATVVIAGFANIAKIKAQQMSQAHAGLTEVPKSLDNSTFLLKAGERIVQPEQNLELGKAIEKINSGIGSGGHTVNITIMGGTDDSTIEKIKKAVFDGLRDLSERGHPMMSSKGIIG